MSEEKIIKKGEIVRYFSEDFNKESMNAVLNDMGLLTDLGEYPSYETIEGAKKQREESEPDREESLYRIKVNFEIEKILEE